MTKIGSQVLQLLLLSSSTEKEDGMDQTFSYLYTDDDRRAENWQSGEKDLEESQENNCNFQHTPVSEHHHC